MEGQLKSIERAGRQEDGCDESSNVNPQQSFQSMIKAMLTVLFLVGCGTAISTPVPEAPTQTSAPALETVKPSPEKALSTPIPAIDTPLPEMAQSRLSLSNPDKVVFASGSNIYTVDVTTKKLTRLVQVNEQLCCPQWSPDRQKIAFAIGSGMHHGVYVVDAGGSNLQRLTYIQRTDGDRPPLSPVWTEDGQHLDFVYGAYGYGGLAEAVSPDGQSVAFILTRAVNDHLVYELYVKNVDGTGMPKLIIAIRSIAGIDW